MPYTWQTSQEPAPNQRFQVPCAGNLHLYSGFDQLHVGNLRLKASAVILPATYSLHGHVPCAVLSKGLPPVEKKNVTLDTLHGNAANLKYYLLVQLSVIEAFKMRVTPLYRSSDWKSLLFFPPWFIPDQQSQTGLLMSGTLLLLYFEEFKIPK